VQAAIVAGAASPDAVGAATGAGTNCGSCRPEIARMIAAAKPFQPRSPPMSEAAQVLLVGAGPGPVDLMTLRAVRAVESAQALLYDALIGEEAIALAPPGCVRIQTGKRAGKPSMHQDEINRLMLRLARKGLRVVRLKGGDPSVFGRVGEESAFLREHGVSVEVVPGVTAACAAAAQFGFPLTHRGEARRVVFTTARLEAGNAERRLERGGRSRGDHGRLYGRRGGHALCARMIAAGRAPEHAGRGDRAGRRGERQALSRHAGTLGDHGQPADLAGTPAPLARDLSRSVVYSHSDQRRGALQSPAQGHPQPRTDDPHRS
jgi:uroporphyrin-III C-methyltransferase